MIVHGSGHFDSRDGTRLFERWWRPDGEARCVIALVHGYAEHSGRYEHVGSWFAERHIAVEALDLRGHGQSDGERAIVRSFNEYLGDVSSFLKRVKERNGVLPVFLLGHSMGGGITALFVLTRKPDVAGVILSGPALTSSRGRRVMGRVLAPVARFAPKLTLNKLAADTVSRDPAVVAAYDSDPLNYRGGFKLGLAAAGGRASTRITRDMEAFNLPLLVIHGSGDTLVPVDGSEELLRRAASSDRTLKIYDGLYHEVLNEPEKEQVLGDVYDWIVARLPAPTAAATRASPKKGRKKAGKES